MESNILSNLKELSTELAAQPDTWKQMTILEAVTTIEAMQQENEQLQAQAAQIREALKQARSAMYVHLQINDCDCLRNAIKAVDKAIDKIGGREDV